MNTAVRSLVSALTTVALIMALTTTQWAACGGDQAKVSSGSPPCCNPDGHCNSAAGSTRPCFKAHALTPAIVEQTILLAPATRHVNCDSVQLVLSTQAEWPTSAQYSPPYLYLLHSSFLI
jgi:hypothetical protein